MGKDVKLVGKVAEFPVGIKPSDAYAFMERVKVPKNKIWYILVKRQDDTLTTVKYNKFANIDLGQLVENLKAYYMQIDDFTSDQKTQIQSIEVIGEDSFSVIKNIPKTDVLGESLVSRITKDIIKILS